MGEDHWSNITIIMAARIDCKQHKVTTKASVEQSMWPMMVVYTQNSLLIWRMSTFYLLTNGKDPNLSTRFDVQIRAEKTVNMSPLPLALQRYLYGSEYESQMMLVFGKDKRYLDAADSWPYRFTKMTWWSSRNRKNFRSGSNVDWQRISPSLPTIRTIPWLLQVLPSRDDHYSRVVALQ